MEKEHKKEKTIDKFLAIRFQPEPTGIFRLMTAKVFDSEKECLEYCSEQYDPENTYAMACGQSMEPCYGEHQLGRLSYVPEVGAARESKYSSMVGDMLTPEMEEADAAS